MFVTQPTISKMLKNLEDELNCTLLIRDGRKLLLTDTGRVVFERGLAILAEFRQLEAELGDINHLTKGLLRLGHPTDGWDDDGRPHQPVSPALSRR